MLGMGPIIWRKITEHVIGGISPAPGPRFLSGRRDTRFYSGRYYRAIDAVTRDERFVCDSEVARKRCGVCQKIRARVFP